MGKPLYVFIILLVIALAPFWTEASFERDLYYGISNDSDVTRLQEFLRNQGVYDGPVTGNFLDLTRGGVKKFQEREGIAPIAGYFGPKTRARANQSLAEQTAPPASQDAVIADLLAQIKALQAKIQALQAQGTAQPLPVPVPAPSPEATPLPEPIPSEPKELKVSGGANLSFPAGYENPLKIGDIIIKNTTDNKILFSQIILTVKDVMNSPLNRNSDSYLVIRDGAVLTDNEISKTKFTFNSTAPDSLSPHVFEIGMSYPVEVASGEEKKVGLWIELLEYVESGTLEIKFKELQATSPISPVGGFKFVFTK